MASARSDLACVLALPARACDEMRVTRADGEGGGKLKTDDRNGALFYFYIFYFRFL